MAANLGPDASADNAPIKSLHEQPTKVNGDGVVRSIEGQRTPTKPASANERGRGGNRDDDRERRLNDNHRRRSRSPDADRTRTHRDYRYRERDRESPRSSRYTPPPRSPQLSGDHYRPAGRRSSTMSEEDRHYRPDSSHRPDRRPAHRDRTRSRSPARDSERAYDRDRDERARHHDYRERDNRRRSSPRASPRPRNSSSPRARSPIPADDTDRRTVFVQQLAGALKEHQLKKFFEDHDCPVEDATIVKDRISGRSKGVGYVQFRDATSVPKAVNLTGQALLKVPIIVQQSEAEKNRQAKAAGSNAPSASAPFHRLYVGNVHFSVHEGDLRAVFEAWGTVEYVSLQKDDNGRSRGYGFVQYADPTCAKNALEKMNGFDLAGRALRVGLGNDKNHDAAQARVGPQSQASTFSGAGGRGVHAGGSHNYERASHREVERIGGASALDDTDVANVNQHAFDRYSLMQKLARETDMSTSTGTNQATAPQPTPLSNNAPSRCLKLGNCYDTDEEQKASPNGGWIIEIQEDVALYLEEHFGPVLLVKIAGRDSNGDVYVKFEAAADSILAYKSLQGRGFNGRSINAKYMPEGLFDVVPYLKPT